VERLEAAYEHEEGPLNPGYFYVPSTEWTGRDLESDWTDHAPPEERSIRRAAIDATLALRRAVDEGIEAVKCVASCMDGPHESVDRRWTTRTIGELRRLRGAINRGHAPDVVPSALPMIRAGVPEALREASILVAARMEEVKSAMMAGVRPPTDESGPVRKPGGWTKKELIEEADKDVLSATVFGRIRNDAGLAPGERGGKGQQRRFSKSDVRKLIKAVEAGTYRAKKEIAKAWRELIAK
jgi:hypothetical protein